MINIDLLLKYFVLYYGVALIDINRYGERKNIKDNFFNYYGSRIDFCIYKNLELIELLKYGANIDWNKSSNVHDKVGRGFEGTFADDDSLEDYLVFELFLTTGESFFIGVNLEINNKENYFNNIINFILKLNITSEEAKNKFIEKEIHIYKYEYIDFSEHTFRISNIL